MENPKNQSAEEIELQREEEALRTEAEKVDPKRAEDAMIPDVPSEAEARAAARGEKTPEKTKRPGGDKQPDATGAAKPDASKTTDQTAEGTQKTEAQKTADKTAAKPGDTPPDESKMTPFQRERFRLDKGWKELRTERETIAREREQIAQQRRLAEQQQQQRQAETKRPAGPTAADYEEIAKEYEADGRLPLAKQARARAEELRKQETGNGAQPGRQERFTAEEVQTMTQQWQANLEKAGQENPDLQKEGSPLRVRVAELLKNSPLLHQSGDGILYAVAYAKNELKGKRADELETKVGELEKEIQRLTGLTSLHSGGAAPGSAAKKFEELTLDEQEATLREEAAVTAGG